ncbi:NAD(P)H-dependent oxidoreductase [Candidatus Woesearchaeota archaeon]|nr:NAD(P)H-dependent oxidoreductase [Candidatus Woesearchaeota archaeon]
MAYRPKPKKECDMYDPSAKLKALALVASLKHKPEISNTQELTELVAKNLKKYKIKTEIIRLADEEIPHGLSARESKDDDWPKIAKKMIESDIIIFSTPIWWGNISNLMQKIIERMDAMDETYLKTNKSLLYNKVAGIVITGSEDGALNSIGKLMSTLHWMGFTFPPECATYWVGEVGQNPKDDRKKRLKNESTKVMAQRLARNLAYYAQLLHHHPIKEK